MDVEDCKAATTTPAGRITLSKWWWRDDGLSQTGMFIGSRQHRILRFRVWRRWAEQMELGKKLFSTATPACALCHTLKDAGAEGAVGPVMDEIKPYAARVAKALRNGLGNIPSYSNSH